VSTAATSSVGSAVSGCAITIKQEPQDETVKEDYPNVYHVKSKGAVTSQLSTPRNDTLHHTNVEPVPIVPGKVKQEKVDATDMECSKCKVRFQDKSELQKHKCTVMSQWSCQHCNKYFKSKHTLYKHKKYFCPKKKSNFVCRNCGKMFSSVIELAQHQKVHLRICVFLEEDSLYTCTVCRKKFAARSMLEMHKKSHSSGSSYMNQTEEVSFQPSIPTGKVLLKRFKCQYCPSSYTTRIKLKLHMKTHFVGKKNSSTSEWSVETKQPNKNDIASDATPQCSKNFICKYCEYACDDNAALWNHMLQQHSYHQPYNCGKCGRGFRHLHAYSNHQKTHYVKMHCRVCGKQYSSDKALREHEYNKHSIQKVTHHCRLCTESFMTRSELLIHGRTHHTKGKISAPVLEESEVKIGTLPCTLCSKRFPSVRTLVAHMQMHSGTGMGNRNMGNGNVSNRNKGPMPQSSCGEEAEHCSSLTCKICFKVFNSMTCLQRHIKMHATGKHVFYPCKICGKKFVSESTYKNHVATHVSKSFHCNRGNKIFLNKELFKCHICENTEKQACLKCGIRLTEEQHLNHVCDVSISKSLELSERCKICPALFSSVKARNNHMRIHGNRMILATPKKIVKMSNGLYKCTICGKLTPTQQGAAGHSSMHRNVQPVKAYSCPFCNRKYSSESGLYSHITVEHPELPGKLQ
jgi:KRAB domain-containing zinc finger protein